jgi:hypothetical protein
MTITRKPRIFLLAAVIGLVGLTPLEHFPFPGLGDFISQAEARVGRPLTPVSVAGVARRSVRRCAVGVYNC